MENCDFVQAFHDRLRDRNGVDVLRTEPFTEHACKPHKLTLRYCVSCQITATEKRVDIFGKRWKVMYLTIKSVKHCAKTLTVTKGTPKL